MVRLSYLYLALSLGLTSCSTVRQQTDPNAPPFTYKADLQITVNDKTFDGLAVTTIQASVPITIASPVSADRVQITSCNRNDVFEKVRLPFVYLYAPSPIESKGMCILNVQIFSKDALSAWGMVAFKSTETLHAHTYFNAEGMQFSGFSLGQSKAGLEQSIEFPTPIDRFVGEPKCHLVTADKKTFLLRPERGVCRMTFRYKDSWHRSLFIGYDQVLMRQ